MVDNLIHESLDNWSPSSLLQPSLPPLFTLSSPAIQPIFNLYSACIEAVAWSVLIDECLECLDKWYASSLSSASIKLIFRLY
jgi:hypothetical protein